MSVAEIIDFRASAGHWVTIGGNHVMLTGSPVSAEHVANAAATHGLNETAKTTLLNAHANGKIVTDKHLFETIAHAKRLESNGHETALAYGAALQRHGQKEAKAKVTPAKTEDGKPNAAGIAERSDRIMGKLPSIHAAVPGMRARVENDLASGEGASRERVGAAVTRLMDATTMRVGSEEYATKSGRGAAGQDSFGASSLRKEHVSVDGDTVHLSFPGKSRKDWKRSVTDPHLAATVQHLMTLPGDRLMQTKDANGAVKPFTENHTRDYMSQFGMTPKNLRTYHATSMAKELLDQAGPPTSEANAKKTINAVVKSVSEHLGNTPAIARASYIHPAVLESYAKQAGHAVTMSADESKDLSEYLSDAETRFGQWLHETAARIESGELTGRDPFPEDLEPFAGDDESGQPTPRFTMVAFAKEGTGEMSDFITRDVQMFQAGNYPDKGVSVTVADLHNMAKNSGRVPIQVGHVEPEFRLGEAHSYHVIDDWLYGKFDLHPAADTLLTINGMKNVSVGMNPSKTHLLEVSATGSPRVQGARMFSNEACIVFSLGEPAPALSPERKTMPEETKESITAVQFSALEARMNEERTARLAVERKLRETEAKQKVKELGQIPPAAAIFAIALLSCETPLTFSDKGTDTEKPVAVLFSSFLDNLPKDASGQIKYFADPVKGDAPADKDKEDEEDAAKKLDGMTKDKMDKDKTSYSVAFAAICRENKELAQSARNFSRGGTK
jgi:DNA topoisomerase IB